MCRIGLRPLQVYTSEKASRPVPLASIVPSHELVVVYRTICLIQGICALSAPVVGQTGRDADAGSCEQQCLARWPPGRRS